MKTISHGIHIFSHPFILGLLGYIGIILVLFWPVLFPPQGTLIFGDDIHRSYHFFRMYERSELQKGTIPWWNPYQFSGEPFVANPSVTFWYPPNWLFFFMEYRYAYAIIIPLHILLAMIGMYWLARQFMGQMAAWCTGLIFGLSGFFMGRLWAGHIDIVTSAPYLPIVFGCMWRALEKKTFKHIVIVGAVFSVQMYAGYQTMAYFTGWALIILVIIWSLKEKSLRPFIILITTVIIAAGLAALQIIPAQEFFHRSIRTYSFPYSWAVMGSYTVDNLKQFLFPFLLGVPQDYSGPSPNYGEFGAYIGVLPLELSLIAVCVYIFKRRKIFQTRQVTYKELCIIACIVIGFLGLWVSFGWNAPVDLQYILWRVIPFYKYLRIPSRHLILVVFSLSILFGFGFDLVKKKSLRFILVGYIVVDLLIFAGHFIALQPDPEVRHNKELVSYLQRNTGLTRVLQNFNVGMGTRDALDFDAFMAYRMYSATGYDPAILRNYYDFIVAANGLKEYDVQQSDVQIPILNPLSRYVDFLNIKHILVPTWLDTVGEAGQKYKAVLEETKKDYWRLYENTTVMPRFYLVPQATILKSHNEVFETIRTGSVDYRKEVLISNNKPSSKMRSRDITRSETRGTDCPEERLQHVKTMNYTSNKIQLGVSTSCGAYLVSLEVWYPGWEATIDGKKTDILEGNLAFRTIWVPSGNHTIVMQYQPYIFMVGGGISMVTFVVCGFIVIRKRTYET